MSGSVDETYLAAIQHDLADLSGDERLVGVVRRPTGWFRSTVHENVPELGPPEDLLDETKAEEERLRTRGLRDEEAHNAAWDAANFDSRYRTYLTESSAARDEIDRLATLVTEGEDVVLVCFEGEKKRCHRRILIEAVRERADARAARGGGVKPLGSQPAPMTLETMEPNPVWVEDAYADTVGTLRDHADDLVYKVWGGDWCKDCRSQLPDFGAALEAADVPDENVEHYPVEKEDDGTKVGPRVEEYGIEYIPTVVVEHEGEEIARFVEDEPVPIAVYLADEIAAELD